MTDFNGTAQDEDINYTGSDTWIAYGNGGNDTLWGNGSDDFIDGGDGNDLVRGWYGDDLLYGGRGNDVLKGEDGNDFLCGYGAYGGSNEIDVLMGGDGADTFGLGYNGSYTEVGYTGTGFALINDFDWQEGDRIRLGGSIDRYSLTESGGSTSINYNGDRIGFLVGVTGLDLHASYFSFAGGHGS